MPPASSRTLAPGARPRALVKLELADKEPLSIDLAWCELQFTRANGERVAALLASCDGSRDLPAIATALGWPVERVTSLASVLYARGVLVDDAHQDVAADLCQEHLVAWGRTLRARMSAQVDLLGGELHRRRLLGSLVETYHFVSSASYHIGAAVAHAPSTAIRDGLSRLFADEWKHGRDLRKGLLAAGLSEREIDASQPLPETRSVINYLRALGSTDLLSYGVCAAINESPKSDTAIKKSWDDIARLGLLPVEAITPFRGHELEDEASDHAAISVLLFSEHGAISGTQQQQIRDHVVSFLATQRGCYIALKRYYAESEGPALFHRDAAR